MVQRAGWEIKTGSVKLNVQLQSAFIQWPTSIWFSLLSCLVNEQVGFWVHSTLLIEESVARTLVPPLGTTNTPSSTVGHF